MEQLSLWRQPGQGIFTPPRPYRRSAPILP